MFVPDSDNLDKFINWKGQTNEAETEQGLSNSVLQKLLVVLNLSGKDKSIFWGENRKKKFVTTFVAGSKHVSTFLQTPGPSITSLLLQISTLWEKKTIQPEER